jgi:hypothetical protein
LATIRNKAVIVLAAMLGASTSVYAAADCSLTSLSAAGLAGGPIAYVRSAVKGDEGYQAAQQIVPRDTAGNPSTSGKVGFLMIGNSNARTTHIFYRQVYLADTTRRLSTFVPIQAAQAGKTATEWADPAGVAWTTTATNVAGFGIASLQVQAAHVMMTEQSPATRGAMREAQLRQIVANLLANYPNVKMVWFSPMNYTGYSGTYTLAPEPFINHDAALMAQLVDAPDWPVWVDFLDLWADGVNAHPQTGLSYACADVAQADGVHPYSPSSTEMIAVGYAPRGAHKMALSLHDRWMADPLTARWMRVGASAPPPAPTTHLEYVEGSSDGGLTWALIQSVSVPNQYTTTRTRLP